MADDAVDTSPAPLLVWGVGTFHTTLVLVSLVVALYLFGDLGGLLSGLRTSVGIGLYLLLWVTTLWTTRAGLSGASLTGTTWREALATVGRAGGWGGVNGVLFFVGLLLIVFHGEIVSALLSGTISSLGILTLILALGLAIAFAVGFGIAVAIGAIDVILFWIAERIVGDE